MNVRKRGLALVMCICMLLTLMPMSVLADEAPAPDVVYGEYNANGEWEQSDNGGSLTYDTDGGNTLKLSKTAEKADGDNTYKITLKVESSQSTTTTPPGAAATVLVIDVSGSMGYCAECGAEKSHLNNCKYYKNKDNSVKSDQTRLKAAQDAAISFLDSYKGDTSGTGRYVSLVKFESKSSVVKEWVDVSTAAGYDQIKTAVNGLKADGGTNLDAALSTANSQFTSAAVSAVASKNVVALTDGIPTFYGGGTSRHGNYGCPDTNAATAASASTLRNTASVYTVCFGAANQKCWTKDSVHGYFGLIPDEWHAEDGPLVGDFLRNSIATPATADKIYAYNANNTAELMSAFAAITTSITTGIAAGVVNDPMGANISVTHQKPDNFIEGENGYTWTLSGAPGVPQGDKVVYTYELSYYVKLDTTGVGFDENKYYPTNGVTTFTSGGREYYFPVPGVKGTIPSFNVSYAYTGTVPAGAPAAPAAATAKQNSTVTVAAAPTLDGYVFSGWATTDAAVNNGTFTMPGKDVEFTGSWQPRGDLSYTVNYYRNGTTTPVAPSKTVNNVTFGTNITAEAPIAVEGYTAVPDQTCNLKVGTDLSTNVINFYYYENVHLVANSDTVPYDGEEHSVSGFTGAPADANFSNISVGAKGTEVGEYNAAFTKSTTGTVDTTKKYIVASAADGKLIITPIDAVVVTITGKTDTKPYNGEKQSVAGYEFESNNPLYTKNCFSFDGSAVAEGTDADTYMMGLKAEQFKNTSKNFTSVEFIVTDGKLEISKRSVIMTSASDEKFFDGEPLTNDTVTVTGDGFVEGEGASYDVTGTQTKTGESDNTFTYKLNENTKADNYKIEIAFGKLVVKQLLEKEDHFNYVIGYPDKTIRPEGQITRAEVATIFFRLLTDDARQEFDSVDNKFSDVNAGVWYNRAISTLAKAGILTGYTDGTFRPDAPITRAEMATIIARFDKLTETGKTFKDIEGHWAQEYIELAATNGWINGDGDGNFRPDDAIKRDETFAMINRVLERQVDTVKDLLPQSEMNMWVDNMDEGAWYYKDVQEATNYHKCNRIDYSEYEIWTEKLPDIDWATYQI